MTPAYVINTIFYTFPCFLLLYLSFKEHVVPPVLPKIILGIIFYSLAAFWGSYIFVNVVFSSILHAFLTLLFIFLGACIFCSIVDYNLWQGIFIVAILRCYAENVRLISLYLYFITSRRLPDSSDLRFACTTLILVTISFYSIYTFFTKLLFPALDCTTTLSTWKIMWVIPVFSTIIQTLVMPNINASYIFPENEFYFLPPLWTVLTFSTLGIVLRMIINMNQNVHLREALHLSETQLTAQQKQLESLQQHAEHVRRLRHDTRHHVLTLQGLVKGKNNQELERYLQELSDGLPPAPENYCDIPAVNALLCHYHDLAITDRIKATFLVSLPDELPFSDMDLCIILGNFLENAIEACRRMKSEDRFITLKLAMPSRRTLVILTENSYEGVIQRMKDGSFLSSKEKDRKGIGISSVLHITEKYNGIPRFEYQNHLFRASLLLNARE